MLSYAMLQLQGRSHVGILPRGVSRVSDSELPICAGNPPIVSFVHLLSAGVKEYVSYISFDMFLMFPLRFICFLSFSYGPFILSYGF